jgi:hypothetical protein
LKLSFGLYISSQKNGQEFTNRGLERPGLDPEPGILELYTMANKILISFRQVPDRLQVQSTLKFKGFNYSHPNISGPMHFFGTFVDWDKNQMMAPSAVPGHKIWRVCSKIVGKAIKNRGQKDSKAQNSESLSELRQIFKINLTLKFSGSALSRQSHFPNYSVYSEFSFKNFQISNIFSFQFQLSSLYQDKVTAIPHFSQEFLRIFIKEFSKFVSYE